MSDTAQNYFIPDRFILRLCLDENAHLLQCASGSIKNLQSEVENTVEEEVRDAVEKEVEGTVEEEVEDAVEEEEQEVDILQEFQQLCKDRDFVTIEVRSTSTMRI